jgi:hypothetical protein
MDHRSPDLVAALPSRKYMPSRTRAFMNYMIEHSHKTVKGLGIAPRSCFGNNAPERNELRRSMSAAKSQCCCRSRSGMLEKRKSLMQAWARFLAGPVATAKVVPLEKCPRSCRRSAP